VSGAARSEQGERWESGAADVIESGERWESAR
jgi:hypothetical protein